MHSRSIGPSVYLFTRYSRISSNPPSVHASVRPSICPPSRPSVGPSARQLVGGWPTGHMAMDMPSAVAVAMAMAMAVVTAIIFKISENYCRYI